jgi:hypothetical protein
MSKIRNVSFTLVAMAAAVFVFGGETTAGTILIDYDDGLANGIHDAVVNDGEFTTTTGANDPWSDLVGNAQFNDSGGPDAPTGSGTNYVSASDRLLAINTGYTIQAGDTFDFSYWWIDKSNFDDGSDTVQMVLYVTADDTIAGTDVDTIVLHSGLSQSDSTWEQEIATGQSFTAAAAGKTLFARLENNANATGEFARWDNIYVEAVPEPSTFALSALSLIGLIGVRRRRKR